MNIKNALIFLSGVGLGAVSTYFILKDKFEQQANEEAENLKAYYEDKYRIEDNEEPDDIPEDAVKERLEHLREEDEKEKKEENISAKKINPYKVPCPQCGEIMRVDDKDDESFYLACDKCNVSGFYHAKKDELSFDKDGEEIPF